MYACLPIYFPSPISLALLNSPSFTCGLLGILIAHPCLRSNILQLSKHGATRASYPVIYPPSKEKTAAVSSFWKIFSARRPGDSFTIDLDQQFFYKEGHPDRLSVHLSFVGIELQNLRAIFLLLAQWLVVILLLVFYDTTVVIYK